MRFWVAHPSRVCGLATRSCGVDAFKKWSQPGRHPELRNRVQFLEGRGKRVREAPHGSRCELFILGIKIAVMHNAGQVLAQTIAGFEHVACGELLKKDRELFIRQGSPDDHHIGVHMPEGW